MTRAKLVVDADIILDYLNERDPYHQKARLLMIAGKVGEFDLWMSATQVTDLLYSLSDGEEERMQLAQEQVQGLRTFIHVYAAGEAEVDAMLKVSCSIPDCALLGQIALALQADAVITHEQSDFEHCPVRAFGCDEFFLWMQQTHGIAYDEIVL